MKAQVNLEFIVAIFIFLTILSYTLITIFNSIPSIQANIITENMRTEAWTISDILLFDKGYPNNWQNLGLEEVKRIGLAGEERYSLERDKLDKLSDFCAENNYPDFKERFGLDFTDMVLEIKKIDDSENWFCRPPAASSTAREVEVTRLSILEGDIVKIKVVLLR